MFLLAQEERVKLERAINHENGLPVISNLAGLFCSQGAGLETRLPQLAGVGECKAGCKLLSYR